MIIEAEKFNRLCEESYVDTHGSWIGIYNEKMLHKVLKRFFCEDESCHEKKVGSFTADVLCGNDITEIQTKNLYALKKKLAYYLSRTDHNITVVYPVISDKRILRVDRESGEVLRMRKSPKKMGHADVMQELYRISEFIPDERLCICVIYIEAEEHRYSDEMVRYRKSGKYDSALFPKRILNSEIYSKAEDFKFLLEGCSDIFSAADYKKLRGISGRPLYSVLNLLCNVGLLEREKNASGVYEYKIKE